MKLAGAPIESHSSITNPVLSPNLQDVLLNQGPAAFFGLIIPRMVGLTLVIGVLIFFFIMLIGGIQWIASGGDKAAVESARGKIANALVGIVILFCTFAILKIIEDFFGINILVLDIGSLQIQ
jgi:hypothetical protein